MVSPLSAVGKAFDEEVCPHPDVLKALGITDHNSVNSGWKKMAMVPKSTKVYTRADKEGSFFFLLMVVRNVHCYPGVPGLVKGIFQGCKVCILWCL